MEENSQKVLQQFFDSETQYFYSVIEDLFSDKIKGFAEDMLKGEYSGIKIFICNQIYEFCKKHSTFEFFIKNIEQFKILIS